MKKKKEKKVPNSKKLLNSEPTTPQKSVLPTFVAVEDAKGFDRFDEVYQNFSPNQISAVTNENNLFIFICENKLALEVGVFSEHIFRFRYAPRGRFEKYFSYAVQSQAIGETILPHFSDHDTHYELKTSDLRCTINKKDLFVTIFDKNEKILCEDAKKYHAQTTILKGTTIVEVSKKIAHKEQFFGLGDKSCPLNLLGERLENWASDAFAFGKKSDPLYRSVPFYYGLNDGRSYGIFLDNSHRSFFDFGKTDKSTVTISAVGGELCYYFLGGDTLTAVAQNYVYLTGKPELPPLWAFGFHQCRWSYFPESHVREIANSFRTKEIPCDAIYFDIDYMDKYRCFTWNKTYFPNPTQLISDLKKQGFQSVVMIDPGIKVDENYKIFSNGLEKNMFCHRTNGELMIGPVWPSDCVFPEFTDPNVRAWWGELYRDLYEKNDVSGFWNDMNEPAVFKVNRLTFPDEVRHDYDGNSTNHAKAHNIYGMQMSRATVEGLQNIKSQKRYFLLSRASFSGGQRYCAVWTGDNVASWEHLRLANIQCQRLSISGFSFVGTDIGGFVDTPSGELFIRWLQLGIFHPLFRIHSMGNHEDGSAEVVQNKVEMAAAINRLDREPWAYGEAFTPIAKATIELRYQLLPYLYSAFKNYVTTGVPVLRSLSFVYQNDAATYGIEREFLFGDHLLVSPVLLENQSDQILYLPEGGWYYFWTGEFFIGKNTVSIKNTLSQIPFFIKAGGVLPLYPIQQFTNEKPVTELTLHIYFKLGDMQSSLYEDAGEGYDYKTGAFSEKVFFTHGTTDTITVKQTKTGSLSDSYKYCKIIFYGIPFQPSSAKADNLKIDFLPSTINNTIFTVLASNDFRSLSISK